MFALLIPILTTTLMYSTPLIFSALGEVISERSGVINIGIEGIMTIGAFVAASVAYYTANPWMGLLAGGIVGGVVALLHAIASVTFAADQTISGIALNFIGPGLSIFLCKIFFNGQTKTYPIQNKLPRLFYTLDITVLLALICALLIYFMFKKTKLGLRIRAIGENPYAADSLGINVYRMRYLCVIFSGILAGLGGSVTTLSVVSQFSPSAISGQGFIALAAVIFGKWTSLGAYFACLFFAFAQALAVTFGGTDFIPSELLSTLPYVLTILILVFFVGRSASPKANGKPYIKGER